MEELIDFPSSALWNNYYADRGLTSVRHSTDPRRPLEPIPAVIVPFDQDAWESRLGVIVNQILRARAPSSPMPAPRRPSLKPYRGVGHAT